MNLEATKQPTTTKPITAIYWSNPDILKQVQKLARDEARSFSSMVMRLLAIGLKHYLKQA